MLARRWRDPAAHCRERQRTQTLLTLFDDGTFARRGAPNHFIRRRRRHRDGVADTRSPRRYSTAQSRNGRVKKGHNGHRRQQAIDSILAFSLGMDKMGEIAKKQN